MLKIYVSDSDATGEIVFHIYILFNFDLTEVSIYTELSRRSFLFSFLQIIFTYLEADLDGVCMKWKPDISEPQPVIHYTRPYDFIDASQRSEILDSLFWFGYVQSAAYKLWMKD